MKIPVWREFSEFHPWAEERAKALAMEARTCSIPELAPDWAISEGVLGRPDDRFFKVRGVQVTSAAGREVSGWGQPMVCDDGGGYVALITLDSHNPSVEGRMLVRMKGEPGHRGMFVEVDDKPFNTRVMVCPPAQFSQGNLDHNRKALKGELDSKGKPCQPVPFASLALTDAQPVWAQRVSWHEAAEDGGRFYLKTNRYGVAEVDERQEEKLEAEIEATGRSEDFAWISRGVLRAIFQHPLDNNLANFHLRSVCSLLV